jgi:hypothetical protein
MWFFAFIIVAGSLAIGYKLLFNMDDDELDERGRPKRKRKKGH